MFERKFIGIAQKRLGSSFLGRNGWAHVPADLLKFWLKQNNKHQTGWNTTQHSALAAIFGYFIWSLLGSCFFLSEGVSTPIDLWDYQWFLYFGYANLTSLYMFHVAMGQRSKYTTIAAGRIILMSVFMEVFFSACFMFLYWHTTGFTIDTTTASNTWLLFSLPPLASIFFLYTIFEAKRAPFDHTEAESELVAGHQIEFSGRSLLFFLLCEYVHLFFCIFLVLILCFNGADFFSIAPVASFFTDAIFDAITINVVEWVSCVVCAYA